MTLLQSNPHPSVWSLIRRRRELLEATLRPRSRLLNLLAPNERDDARRVLTEAAQRAENELPAIDRMLGATSSHPVPLWVLALSGAQEAVEWLTSYIKMDWKWKVLLFPLALALIYFLSPHDRSLILSVVLLVMAMYPAAYFGAAVGGAIGGVLSRWLGGSLPGRLLIGVIAAVPYFAALCGAIFVFARGALPIGVFLFATALCSVVLGPAMAWIRGR
jgi:hypothetical protein